MRDEHVGRGGAELSVDNDTDTAGAQVGRVAAHVGSGEGVTDNAVIGRARGGNSNLYFTETEKNIMASMRCKSRHLTKVRGANMAGGANRNLPRQGAERHMVKKDII